MSARLYGGGLNAPAGSDLTGVLFTQGDDATASLTAEFLNAETLKMTYKENGAEVTSNTINIIGGTTQWAPDGSWNSIAIQFQPGTAGSYAYQVWVNTALAPDNGALSLPGFDLPSRRITIGNGWSGSEATSNALSVPMQGFSVWELTLFMP